MEIAIKINVETGRLQDRLHYIKRRLPEEIGNAGRELMEKFATNLRFQLNATSKRWQYKILSSIRTERKSKNVSVVKISRYGIYLDRMRPHWVALKKGRLITKWANEKGIYRRYLFVKPHPFIVDGLIRTYPYINSIIKIYAHKAVVES